MTIREQIISDTLKIASDLLLARLLAFVQALRQEESAKEGVLKVSDPLAFLASLADLRVYTIDEIMSPTYIYQPIDKLHLVGAWPGNEPVEELLKLISK